MGNGFNIILAVIATILWGIWAIFEKKVAISTNVYWANVYYGFVGLTLFPVYLFFALKFGGPFHFKGTTLSWAYLAGILAAAAGVIFIYLLSKNPANWVTAFTASYPIVTFLISVLFLHEPFSTKSIIGAIFVVIGLFFLNL